MLNSNQKMAVYHGEGPMLVTAGPGSGKTHVLTTRIQHLIVNNKIPPETILVLTFTRDAATSMKTRFEQICPIYKNQVVFGTFHSFFYHILRSDKQFKDYSLLDTQEKRTILYQILKPIKQSLYQEESYGYELPNLEECCKVIEAISAYRNTGNIEFGMKLMPFIYKNRIEDIMDAFTREKWLRHKLDMDDLMIKCHDLLSSDKELLQKWQNKFRYYLIDEFQDCNLIQYNIIKRLVKAPYNLFAVGDDDQSIYGFRGSDRTIMKKMLVDYADTQLVELGTNYRCADDIVKASVKVIVCNKDRFPKSLEGCGREQGRVNIKEFITKEEEYLYLCDTIRKISDTQLTNTAILVRTNQSIQIISGYLKNYNIPCIIKENTKSLTEHFITKDLLCYLQIIEGHRERELFLRIFQRPRIPIGRECLKKKVIDPYEILNFYKQTTIGASYTIHSLEDFCRKLSQAEKLPFPLRIRYIVNGFGYMRYLNQKAGDDTDKKEEWLDILDLIQNAANDLHSSEELEFQLKLLDNKKIIKQSTQSKPNGVHLMTLHGAKGLEYNTVFLPDLNEGVLPNYRKGEKLSMEQIEEERRLFYVGMTRAKERLEILSLKGNRERPKEPSRFLLPLI